MNESHTSLDEFDQSPLCGRHHARFHVEGVLYHVLSRTFQGTGILRPSPTTNACIAGVVSRGLELYPSISIYAHAFMSNHFHLMLSGTPSEIPVFVGYLKKEISRRLGTENNWQNTMWGQPYESTALVTHEDQVHCLKYILSQGVKEGIVDRPEQWPGLHSAKSRCGVAEISGWWIDGTRLAKARYREQQKKPGSRKPMRPQDFRSARSWRETRLPGWAQLNGEAYSTQIKTLLKEVTEQGRRARKGKSTLGATAVLRTSLRKRWSLPKIPFYQLRRKMVCWAQVYCKQVRAYLRRYWQFQRDYRRSSAAFALDSPNVSFPANAYIPGRFVAAG